jgi:hypothetical protein
MSRAEEKVKQRVAKVLAKRDRVVTSEAVAPTPRTDSQRELKIDGPIAGLLGLGPFGYQALDMPYSAFVGLASWAVCLVLLGRITWVFSRSLRLTWRLALTAFTPLLLAALLRTPVMARLAEIQAKLPVLSAQQKRDFSSILRTSEGQPKYVRIACPPADERTCIYAATFVPLFQRAGWHVSGSQVERTILLQPKDGVVISKFGQSPKDPQNPDMGVWTEFTAWDQVLATAFRFLGVNPQTGNDPSLEPGTFRIYFGSSPK